MGNLTHLDGEGRARMVDVSNKEDTVRVAVARGTVRMKPETFTLIKSGGHKKGDVLGVAQVAGIMGAKKTAEVIPMCHPLLLSGVEISFNFDEVNTAVEIEAVVKTTGPTGVEMEALTAVSCTALTIYDMCKAVDKEMTIGDIRLVSKTGGKSGCFLREGEEVWVK